MPITPPGRFAAVFGFVTVAPALLSIEQKTRYRARYCGLCRALGQCGGSSCRLLLTYDLVFLEMLLASVYGLPETFESRRCLLHPIKPHPEIRTDASDYAAAMNVLLGSGKLRDDWQDDHNPVALAAASWFGAACDAIGNRYPRQQRAVADCLSALDMLEQDNETNPDLPAECFGRLTGELILMEEDSPLNDSLRRFGQALGRFVYLIDAAADLREDLRRERYNPLISAPPEEIPEWLHIAGGQVMRRFEALPLTTDRNLLEHILCAGIWGNYDYRLSKYAKRKGRKNRS